MEEFKYYSPHAQQQQFHHSLIQPPRAQQQVQQPSNQEQQQQAYLSAASSNSSASSISPGSRGLSKISDSLLRCTMNAGPSGNGGTANDLNSTISLLNNLNDQEQRNLHHQQQQQQQQHNHHLAYMNSIPSRSNMVGTLFHAVAADNLAAKFASENNNVKKAFLNNSMVYSMDRLSPYETGGYVGESSGDTNRSGHTHTNHHHQPSSLDLVFKGVSGSNNPNGDVLLMNPSASSASSSSAADATTTLLLLNQQQQQQQQHSPAECMKPSYSGGGAANSATNASTSAAGANNRPSSVNSSLSSISADHSAGSSSSSSSSSSSASSTSRNITASPAGSTSPSSSNDTASNYGGSSTMSSSILNGTLTPPPDSALECPRQQVKQQQQSLLRNSAIVGVGGGGDGSNVPVTTNPHQNMDSVPTLASLVPVSSSLVPGTSGSASYTSLGGASQANSAALLSLMSSSGNASASAASANIGSPLVLSKPPPSNISEMSNSPLGTASDSGSSSRSPAMTPNGGSKKRARSNKNASSGNDMQKDCKYFERRKRNNVAAKKSRDARKQREDEIAIRASYLEKENSILKAQLQTLRDEAQQLRILLAQKKSGMSSMSNQSMTTSSCSNCSNCSALAAASLGKANNLGGMNMGGMGGGLLPVGMGGGGGSNQAAYLTNPNIAAQLSAFDTGNGGGGNLHSIPVDLDKQGGHHHITLNNLSPTTAAAAAAAAYLPQQHRHPII